MIYLLGILISLTAGFLFIRLLSAGRLPLILHLLLSLVLGFGIDGQATFYTHILFNQFNHFLPIGIVLLMIGLISFLFYQKFAIKVSQKSKKSKTILPVDTFWGNITFTHAHGLGLLTLIILAFPLAVSAHYYPLGGWDAWSCWSLKAKFIFLGQENWKDVLASGLWRSNTHYPLLWPLINVWFWDLGNNFNQAVPMLNSIIVALLTAGIVLFGILELTGMLWASIAAAVLITTLPFGITLSISQYSDALVGLFLLSTFTSLLLAKKYNLPKLKILSMVFLGLMSFTKNEGLVLAGIAALLIIWNERANKKDLKNIILTFLIAALPTIIFTLFIAPKNEAFTNGLTSTDKPTTWGRWSIILVAPWIEFISSKWHCLWILILGGILLAGKKLWQSTLGLIGLTLILYLGVVIANYAINTYFEIMWWISTTLSRILFALVPTIALWIGVSLLTD